MSYASQHSKISDGSIQYQLGFVPAENMTSRQVNKETIPLDTYSNSIGIVVSFPHYLYYSKMNVDYIKVSKISF